MSDMAEQFYSVALDAIVTQDEIDSGRYAKRIEDMQEAGMAMPIADGLCALSGYLRPAPETDTRSSD
jgi:hypothetical protein